jgi:hypothetical protein
VDAGRFAILAQPPSVRLGNAGRAQHHASWLDAPTALSDVHNFRAFMTARRVTISPASLRYSDNHDEQKVDISPLILSASRMKPKESWLAKPLSPRFLFGTTDPAMHRQYARGVDGAEHDWTPALMLAIASELAMQQELGRVSSARQVVVQPLLLEPAFPLPADVKRILDASSKPHAQYDADQPFVSWLNIGSYRGLLRVDPASKKAMLMMHECETAQAESVSGCGGQCLRG